jgi:hypothetical protein
MFRKADEAESGEGILSLSLGLDSLGAEAAAGIPATPAAFPPRDPS